MSPDGMSWRVFNQVKYLYKIQICIYVIAFLPVASVHIRNCSVEYCYFCFFLGFTCMFFFYNVEESKKKKD